MKGLSRWAPLLAVAALGAIGLSTLARPAPEDAEPYHRRVRDAVAAVPRQVGDWVGHDAEVPQAAQQLLKPNALLSRTYREIDSNVAVTVVIVHTRDARDMLGHYPPNCYPRAGWTLEGQQTRTWTVDGLTLTGTEYTLSFTTPAGEQRRVIQNLLILPGGAFARDMGEVITLASDYTRHFFGAGQVQIITAADMPADQRDEVFATAIEAIRPVIDALHADSSHAATTAAEAADET